jgi:hypothetical protein
VADEVSKILVANEANVIDVIIAADKAIVTNKVIEAIVIGRANLANKAKKANMAEANKLVW